MDEALGKVILEAFKERTGGRQLVCNLCGGTRWGVDGVSSLSLQDRISNAVVIGGKALPLVSLTCEVCGYTLLLNVIRLVGRERFEQARKEGKADAILEEAQRSIKTKEVKHEEGEIRTD